MTRAERYAQVKALRDQGLLLREIGEHLGIARSTVHDLLTDPSGDLARARKRRYERPCIDCGKTINPNGLRSETTRCRTCHGAFERSASRRWVLDSIREWADLHGGIPPVAADWNPRLAEARGQEWRVERLTATERPWPQVSLAQNHFGSWRAAVEEAGFEPFAHGCYGRDGEDPGVCADFAARYLAGESAYAIAQAEGLSQSGVADRIRRAGVQLRSLAEAHELRRAA